MLNILLLNTISFHIYNMNMKNTKNVSIRIEHTPRLHIRGSNSRLTVIKICFKALSHQSVVLAAFPQRSKKLQIAEVRAVQSPVTLWKRCAIA